MSLSLKPNALVTGSFDIVGMATNYAGTSICASPTASSAHFPFDAFFGAITEGGTSIGVVTSLDISLDNGISPQYVIMQRASAFVTYGKSTVTGTLSAFFENAVMLDKFLSETPSSLSLTLGNGTARSYEISLPHIIYTGADNPASDDGPITLSMPFSAILDTATGTNIQITRIA